ncbi:MAG TPA: hypothetical protein VFV34_14340 [Blastocatellia bacterium]|nr:hypothetical protein [Blastocatellia bacterium]
MKVRLPSTITVIITATVLALMVTSAMGAQKAAPKPAAPKPAAKPAAPKVEKPAPAGAPQEKKPKAKKRKPKAPTGTPKGVQACIDRLIQIASADPLPAYEGQPETIINGGLLWNDPKSKCSIGDDQALRAKVGAVAKAWREKNADQVRSLLQELKSAAPQG